MIAIIDYGMGNLQSICNAFELLGADVKVVTNPTELKTAAAIVLPGVGAFGDGMKNLQEKGFLPHLQDEIIKKKKPYLGICLGMQFLAKKSDEHGVHEGLGWVEGEVKLIAPEDKEYKIPHMGWNTVTFTKSNDASSKVERVNILFNTLGESETFYFVHSYALVPPAGERGIITGTAWHGTDIIASIQKENIFGVQFHPEKSQGAGLKVLENFHSFVKDYHSKSKS